MSRFEQLRRRKVNKQALLQDYLRGRNIAFYSVLNDLDQVKLFMVESKAFERFRENLENFIPRQIMAEERAPLITIPASFFSFYTWHKLQQRCVEAVHGLRMFRIPGGIVRTTWLWIDGRSTPALESCRPGQTMFTWKCVSLLHRLADDTSVLRMCLLITYTSTVERNLQIRCLSWFPALHNVGQIPSTQIAERAINSLGLVRTQKARSWKLSSRPLTIKD
jgi:hypothetical protein